MRRLGWSFAALTTTAALRAVVVVLSGSVALLATPCTTSRTG
jgi:divalent metal cation (Fe/Co/Zn/Cd) transporter